MPEIFRKEGAYNVGRICAALGGVCCRHLFADQGGRGGSQFQSGHRHPHHGGAGDGLGDGAADGKTGQIAQISSRSWLFLTLSGIATGLSWLCYYYALQQGPASKVVPIDKLSVVITLILAWVFLHEQFNMKSLIGAALIAAGTLVMVL